MMRDQKFCALSIALVVLACGVLGGCTSYHSFDGARAQSAAVLEALAENGSKIDADDPDDFRRERFRYISAVQERVADADEIRIRAMSRKMSARDAHLIGTAFETLYGHLGTLARLPARLKEDGTAADEETAALFEKATARMAELDG